jgi:hypothetical protein
MPDIYQLSTKRYSVDGVECVDGVDFVECVECVDGVNDFERKSFSLVAP